MPNRLSSAVLTASVVLIGNFAMSQISYIPPKPDHTSESDYRRGRLILENSYAQIRSEKNGIFAADYWNIAIAYVNMGQPTDSIYILLLKAKATDAAEFCKIAMHASKQYEGIKNVRFYKELGASYESLVKDCPSLASTPAEKIDIASYSKSGGFDKDVVMVLDQILENDQKFRSANYKPELQAFLDAQNMLEIEKMIEKYGYPGRRLVGEKYESVAWLVIQHADLYYQEKYLPIIHEAVLKRELSETPLKMLIDRIYQKRTGYQIFGSQAGVDFADEHTISNVKAKYSLK